MIEMLVIAIALAQSIFMRDARPTWSWALYLPLLLAIVENALTDLRANNFFYGSHMHVPRSEENTFQL